MHLIKKTIIVILSIAMFLFIILLVYNYFEDVESAFNTCVQTVCQGKPCERYPRNKTRKELFGKFDEVLRKNTWICDELPLTLHHFPGSNVEWEEVSVSKRLEYEETGVTCEFTVTRYGFFLDEFDIILYCCSDEDGYEFFLGGPNLY